MFTRCQLSKTRSTKWEHLTKYVTPDTKLKFCITKDNRAYLRQHLTTCSALAQEVTSLLPPAETMVQQYVRLDFVWFYHHLYINKS